MRSWAEGLAAIGSLVLVGGALLLFSGESLGDAEEPPAEVVVDLEAAARGEQVANETGCLACHTVDGTPSSGPTWRGLAGSSRPLESGETLVADDSYLLASIVDPNLHVVAGFEPLMPTDYQDRLTESEVDDLIEYVKSLAG